ncbi:restriction endonuclease subunit S [Chromatiaceae bacterium AAb-1]|nr:restriction endonuclease subunit S [Chromatiaceae bacterium AAb-1]
MKPKHMTTIRSIATIYDGPHATPTKLESGPYFLSISSLDKGRLDLSKSASLSEDDFKKWTKRVTPEEGDLLFSYETRLGEAALMPSGIRACLGRRMGLLRLNREKVIPEYALYAYLSPVFQQTIKANTITGATVDRIALNELPDFPIRIPPLDEQKYVARLLSGIDEKIELNNRINTELEAMAKTLYDYWFVQFDFPDANGNPYKTSGGKMVYNSTLKRRIPEDWEVVPLKKLVSLVKGNVSPSEIEPSTPYIGLEHIQRKKLSLEDWAMSQSAESDKTVFKKGDILFGKIRPYFHKVTVAPFDGITSTDTLIFRPTSKNYFGVALEVIFSDEFISLASQSSTGSKMPRADWGVLKQYSIAIPSEELLSQFQVKIEQFVNYLNLTTLENRELRKLRDWLLPLLMNGQVTVTSSTQPKTAEA